jgi:hypothetical protein
VEEALDEVQASTDLDEAAVDEPADGSDDDSDDGVIPDEGDEPHLRMGYFDAPDAEPADKDKDKKKRRFFK